MANHQAGIMPLSTPVQAIAALGKKARDGTISIDDMAGGTFTISNGGVYGSMLSTPIINPPQSAILGMHAITQRAMVVGKEILPRPVMNVALTYDHRLIDGREVGASPAGPADAAPCCTVISVMCSMQTLSNVSEPFAGSDLLEAAQGGH
jgi:2-oxoacid dehydrogenases acyltransferase (catalytic domain)